MKTLNYNVIFRPEPEGGYTVIVPSLQGCVTYGKTLIQAKHMAAEAISLYIETLQKHRQPLPTDEGSFFTTVGIKRKTKNRIYA